MSNLDEISLAIGKLQAQVDHLSIHIQCMKKPLDELQSLRSKGLGFLLAFTVMGGFLGAWLKGLLMKLGQM